MKIHRRQFLIGNQPRKIGSDWKTLDIGKHFFLSYCQDLPVSVAKDLSGNEWYLLGLAIQTEAVNGDPVTEIKNAATQDIKELYKRWNGRWVLIGNGEIHMDCFGLLGCFYTSVNGEKWVSSSLAILSELGSLSPRPENLAQGSDLEFYPPPLTRFEGVRKLLASQVLNIEAFHPEQRELPQPVKGLSYSEIIDRLAEKMKVSLANVAKLNRKIYLPLTAGHDSRLILAAARYSGIEVAAYTAGQPNISAADANLPRKLAKTAGCEYFFINMDPADFSKEKEALYDRHTGGNSVDIDRKRIAHGQWDGFGKDNIVLRGGGLEIGRHFFWNIFRPRFNADTFVEETRPEYEPFKRRAFSEWIDWVNQTPAEGFDWIDRYYWEQRVGGWLSSIEQSLDITGTERFYIANSHDIASLLLTPPVKLRKASQTHLDLIRKMSPDLLHYPLNPVNVFSVIRKKITRAPLSSLYKRITKKAEIYFSK